MTVPIVGLATILTVLAVCLVVAAVGAVILTIPLNPGRLIADLSWVFAFALVVWVHAPTALLLLILVGLIALVI